MAKKKYKELFKTERRRLGDLVPNPLNPRFMEDRDRTELNTSLDKFGLVEILVVDEKNMLLAGHQRQHELLELYGPEIEIDVRVPKRKLTKKQKEEYSFRSNRNIGKFDFDMISEHFDMDELFKYGFSHADFGLADIGDTDGDGDGGEDYIPEIYQILIDCANEQHQKEVLEKFMKDGIPCRALIS